MRGPDSTEDRDEDRNEPGRAWTSLGNLSIALLAEAEAKVESALCS
jgi:hypothetical protein